MNNIKFFFIYIALLGVIVSPNLASTIAQNTTNYNSSDTLIQELREIKALLKEEAASTFWSDTKDTIYSILGIAAPVIIAIFLFWLEQWTRRKHTIQRSCETLLRELEQANESFQNPERRVHRSYFEATLQWDVLVFREIDYNNDIISTDAYDSILHSAFFTEFKSDTQHLLSTFYDRIRIHNRLVLSLSQHGEQTQTRLENQLYLTREEPETVTALLRSIETIKAEKVKLIPLLRLKKLIWLKGNPNRLL